MIVLGIETSCDETAAAVVREDRRILAQVLRSQSEHAAYGGVVPEIAARSHIEQIGPIVEETMQQAGVSYGDLDAVAVTAGPGLIGGVIVGVMYARGLAMASGKPLLAINHLEGHALSARLAADIPFPFLLLLVSGGHCQFLVAEAVGKYRRLGGTLDDALGEAYDKTSKLLGLGYPGGPVVEARALKGDRRRFAFPRALAGREGCDFSFSGIKTAVRQTVQALPRVEAQDIDDLCASFEQCVADVVADRTANAVRAFQAQHEGEGLVVAGGVAANRYLRARLQDVAAACGMTLFAPPLALCTDNAAMIAWAGLERLRCGHRDAPDFEPRARWPLSEVSLTV